MSIIQMFDLIHLSNPLYHPTNHFELIKISCLRKYLHILIQQNTYYQKCYSLEKIHPYILQNGRQLTVERLKITVPQHIEKIFNSIESTENSNNSDDIYLSVLIIQLKNLKQSISPGHFESMYRFSKLTS